MTKPKEEVYMTAKELCEELGIHRSTLVRMHSIRRDPLPECANWGLKPSPHRLYTKAEADVVRERVANFKSVVPPGVNIIEGR